MRVHYLKCLVDYFHAVERGEKPFEVRRDDRGFQKGDVLVLQRFSIKSGYEVDGERMELRRRITYVLTGGQLGIEPGYVVLGLADADDGPYEH